MWAIDVYVSVILGNTGRPEGGYVRVLILKIIMSHQSASKAVIVRHSKHLRSERDLSLRRLVEG